MILTAEVTTVQVGFYSLIGLMTEKGEFYVGIPQIVDLDLIPPNRSRKQLESLSGMVFQSHVKLKTKIHPKAINAISLTDFEVLIAKLDRKGSLKAQEIRDQLVGLSLYKLFCDAFGRKCESEDMQEWLRLRQATKYDFRELTDELKRHGFTEGKEYAMFVYQFQSLVGINSGTRDEQINEKLAELIKVQSILIAYMRCGLKPFEAIKKLKSEYHSN